MHLPHLQSQNEDNFDDDDHHDNDDSSLNYCPSFNTYTRNNITQIVDDYDDNREFESGSGSEFEFDLSGNAEPDSAPGYPVFNRDLLRDLGSSESPVQLRKLFFDEDIDNDPELEGVSPETYCLWAPKSPSPPPTPSRCMKSSSTGSGPAVVVSKTWRLRNLLRRCKSDGKEGLMLVNESPRKLDKKKNNDIDDLISSPSSTRKPVSPGRGGGGGGMRRRKSYLPYKQDLLGFFGSPQTLRKINIPPF